MRQPEPTKDVIEQAAELLMGTNGKTSSLDVKQYLRNKNYWARQRTISESLQELANEKQWDTKFNGNFNEYTIKQASNIVRDAVIAEIDNHAVNSVNGDGDDLRTYLGLDDSEILTIMEALERDLKIDYNMGKSNPAGPSANIQSINTVGDLVNETNVHYTAAHGAPVAVAVPVAPAAPVKSAAVAVKSAPSSITKRRGRSVIMDAKVKSSNPRVTVNIDPIDVKLQDHLDAVKKANPATYSSNWRAEVKNFMSSSSAMGWVLSHNDGQDVRVYDQKYTSDNVRTAYARLAGVKIQDTRSSRLKNL